MESQSFPGLEFMSLLVDPSGGKFHSQQNSMEALSVISVFFISLLTIKQTPKS